MSISVAAASKEKKEAEAAKLKAANAALAQKLKNTGAKIDDDITDDAAGLARDGYDLHFRGSRKTKSGGTSDRKSKS